MSKLVALLVKVISRRKLSTERLMEERDIVVKMLNIRVDDAVSCLSLAQKQPITYQREMAGAWYKTRYVSTSYRHIKDAVCKVSTSDSTVYQFCRKAGDLWFLPLSKSKNAIL
jgi:hypothetical protein